jgi:hypothetical protein
MEAIRGMSYSFHPEAEREFLEAIGRAVEHPKSWPIIDGEVRRCQTKRFPYGVLYSEEAEGIFVIAVMHLHRDPGYWKNRLG